MSSMVIHKNLKDDDAHADVARTFATIAARDLDTAFSSAATNINKNVRVDSPLTIFKLMDVAPTWLDMGQTPGVLASSVFTDNFIVKGDGTNVIQRASGDGIAGLFLNESNDILTLRPGSGVDLGKIIMQSNTGAQLFLIQTDTSGPSDQITIDTPGFLFINSNNDMQFNGAQTIILRSSGASGTIIDRATGGDVDQILRLENNGTNPAGVSIFAGNRNPNSNVVGDPGDLYFSELGAQSALFWHRGPFANTTDWMELELKPVKADFGIDTTTAALGFAQIYACTNTTTTRTITISTSTIQIGAPTLPHRFTIKDETSNAANFMILIFTESGLIDGNTMTSISTDDGAKMFYTDGTNVFIESDHQNPLDAVTFTGNSFNVAGESANPQSMIFSNDGKRVFILDFTSNNIFQYNLTLPFSMASGNVVFSGFQQNVTAQDAQSTTISFNSDGTQLFMAGQSMNAVFEYTLSVPYDLSSTFTNTGDFFNFNAEEGLASSVEWKPDGTKFFLVGRQNNTVFEYDVSTPYDVLTASFSGNSFSVAAQAPAPESLRFSPDGKRFFISGTINDEIFQYNLTTPFSLASGVTFSGFSFDSSGQGDIATSIAFKPDGTKMFLVYSVPNPSRLIHEYDVSPAFSMEGA